MHIYINIKNAYLYSVLTLSSRDTVNIQKINLKFYNVIKK